MLQCTTQHHLIHGRGFQSSTGIKHSFLTSSWISICNVTYTVFLLNDTEPHGSRKHFPIHMARTCYFLAQGRRVIPQTHCILPSRSLTALRKEPLVKPQGIFLFSEQRKEHQVGGSWMRKGRPRIILKIFSP